MKRISIIMAALMVVCCIGVCGAEIVNENITFAETHFYSGGEEIYKICPGEIICVYSITGSSRENTAAVIAALYKNDILTEIKVLEKTVPAGGNKFYKSAVTVPADYETCEIELYVLNDCSGTAPAVKAVTLSSANSDCTIKSITVDGISAKIDDFSGTAEIKVPNETNFYGVTPEITVAEGATVSPASGEAQDFISPVEYTVTAQNGETRTYKVALSKLPAKVEYREFEETFDAMTPGAAPEGENGTWKLSAQGSDAITAADAGTGEDGDLALLIEDKSAGGNNSSAYWSFSGVEGSAEMEFDFRFTRGPYSSGVNEMSFAWIIVGYGNADIGNAVAKIGISADNASRTGFALSCSDGDKGLNDNGNTVINNAVPYAVNNDDGADTGWHKIKMIYHEAEAKVDYYIDGIFCGTFARMRGKDPAPKAPGINFFGVMTSKRICNIYINNLSFKSFEEVIKDEASYFEDFEEMTQGEIPSGDWNVSAPDGTGVQIVSNPYGEGNVLKIEDAATNQAAKAFCNLESIEGSAEVSYDIMIPEGTEDGMSSAGSVMYFGKYANASSAVTGDAAAVLTFVGGAEKTSLAYYSRNGMYEIENAEIAAGEWNTVKIQYHRNAEQGKYKIDVYLNGVLVSNPDIYAEKGEINRISFETPRNTKSEMYIDNVSVKEI